MANQQAVDRSRGQPFLKGIASFPKAEGAMRKYNMLEGKNAPIACHTLDHHMSWTSNQTNLTSLANQ
jgi:hypothetical protein